MAAGCFLFIVGPSGAGKDSLIDGARSMLDPHHFVFARRTITRPAEAIGEAHEACTAAEFESRQAAGLFLASWQAHGLSYGLGIDLLDHLHHGRHVIANGSRNLVAELARKIPGFAVIEITAPADVLAQRLEARGRESAADVTRRLHRHTSPYPDDVKVVQVVNDQSLELGIRRFLATVEGLVGA